MPMALSRRKHSLKFKLEAVRQVVKWGRSVTELAGGLGIDLPWPGGSVRAQPRKHWSGRSHQPLL
jgi:transposase-like protein